MMYREKNIKSGKMFEVEIYPTFPSGRKMPDGVAKSSKAQIKLNDKNARKLFKRKLNANFTRKDLAVHLTWRDDEMPETREEVERAKNNYIRRINYYRRKHGLPELKAMGVIECKYSKTSGIYRWHIHIVMSGMDRDVTEQLWGHGDWNNADRLQPNEYEFEALAEYLSKDPKGSKRWFQTRSIVPPEESKPKKNRLTKIGARKMATMYIDDAAYWERRYKGYRFLKCEPLWNEVNSHWYINVTMRERDI